MVIMVKPLIGLADYAGGFPSPDDIERWKFFGKPKFPVFMLVGCDLETMIHFAWSQRCLFIGKKLTGSSSELSLPARQVPARQSCSEWRLALRRSERRNGQPVLQCFDFLFQFINTESPPPYRTPPQKSENSY